MTSGLIRLEPESPGRAPARRHAELSGAVGAAALAGTLALIAIALGWRGSDLPAQLFRVELFHRYGFVLWDNQWFSGTPTLGYTVLSPLFATAIGPLGLCAACGAASAFLFHRIVHHAFGTSARVASLWFATSTVTNLAVGRVTFALGTAFALAAILGVQRRRAVFALPCALLCGLASPVAALFLVVAAGAWGFARGADRVTAWAVAIVAGAPIAVIAVLFPSPGKEPYELWALGVDLLICGVLWVTVPDRYAALRWGTGLYAIVLLAAYFVATPLGSNVSRLNQYAAGPLIACALWERRRALVIVVAIPILFWQWFPTIDTIAAAHSDPSIHRAYYQPLLAELGAQPQTFGRLEIPATYRHWESAYVAPQFSLARGWERQLDYAYDAQFYDGTLSAASYRAWLSENAVQYVALPDARLDSSSTTEAALLRSRLPYLRPIWHDAHWQLWRVAGFHGLVDGAGSLVALGADQFTVHVTGAGPLTVHIHYSPRWAVQGDGAGCTTATSGGWIQLHRVQPGNVHVVQALHGTRCDSDT